MSTILTRTLATFRRRYREKQLVTTLLSLDDHLLADAGFRRDQLQPDGIRELDALPRPRPMARRPARRAAPVRPFLQGCG